MFYDWGGRGERCRGNSNLSNQTASSQMLLMGTLSFFVPTAWTHGDPRRVAYPTDSQGHFCGQKGSPNEWVWPLCLLWLYCNGNLNALASVPWDPWGRLTLMKEASAVSFLTDSQKWFGVFILRISTLIRENKILNQGWDQGLASHI